MKTKHIFIIIIVGAALVVGSCAFDSCVEAYRDKLSAEFSADQMNVEGSTEYMAYSATVRKLETAANSVSATAAGYLVGVGIYLIGKLFSNEE